MIFRLRKITIDDFCAIGHGTLSMQKASEDAPSNAEILAVYGNNGSGKSSLIKALQIVKKLWTLDNWTPFCGKFIFDFSPHLIRNGAKHSSIRLEIDVETSDGLISIDYALDLLPNGNTLSVSNEVMKISNNEACIILKSGKKPSAYLCKQLAYECIKDEYASSVAKELFKERQNATGNSSFFYHILHTHVDDFDDVMYCLLQDLSSWFSQMAIFSDYDWSNMRHGFFPTPSIVRTYEDNEFCAIHNKRLNQVQLFQDNEEDYELNLRIAEEKIKELNSFLRCVDRSFILETELSNHGEDSISELHIYSSKGNGRRIPIQAESYGRRKILSMSQSLARCMNESSFLLIVDEMDEGLFEYFFGELITAILENGTGQLIYTAHNLISAERLGNLNLAFTTTDPDNRFKRITDVKHENNLRSLYFKEIDGKRSSSSFGMPLDSANISKALSSGYEVVTCKINDSNMQEQE